MLVKKDCKNFSELERSWFFITACLTECLEDFDNGERKITKALIKKIIENCKENVKGFKESYSFWLENTILIDAEDLLIYQLKEHDLPKVFELLNSARERFNNKFGKIDVLKE